MPKRIHLDQAYIDRIKKSTQSVEAEVEGLSVKKAECRFCHHRTIDQYEDLQGHYSAFCPKCGQTGVYKANFRYYSYLIVIPTNAAEKPNNIAI